MVTKPLQSPEFLSLIEIGLMDFRNTPCDQLQERAYLGDEPNWSLHKVLDSCALTTKNSWWSIKKPRESTVTPTDFQRK